LIKEYLIANDERTMICECSGLMERLPAMPALKATGCPSYVARMGKSMKEKNVKKRKKMYTDRGKVLPTELQNT